MLVFFSLIDLNRVLKVDIHTSDKTLHLVSYSLLFLIWSFHFHIQKRFLNNKQNIILIGILICFGIIIELFQKIFTTYRTFDWWDALANTLGIMIGFIAFTIFKHYLIK